MPCLGQGYRMTLAGFGGTGGRQAVEIARAQRFE